MTTDCPTCLLLGRDTCVLDDALAEHAEQAEALALLDDTDYEVGLAW